MKTNAAQILAALDNDETGIFFLVQLGLSEPYRLTTTPYDLTWNGNLYKSEDKLLSFESPRATTVVDRQTYKLRLSGLDDDIKAEVESGIIHRPVSIKMGFIVDDEPQLGSTDLMHVYSGTVANVKKIISDSEQAFAVECSAPLSALDAKSTLFTTRDGMKVFDVTDTSFDQVFEGSNEYTLNWGKSNPPAEKTSITTGLFGGFISANTAASLSHEVHGR